MPGINDIAAKVAEKVGISKIDAKEAAQATIEAIKELSLEGTVTCGPLGIFKIKERAEREGRNPHTGAALTIAAKEVLTFKPTDKAVVRPKKAGAKKAAKAEVAPAALAAPAKRGRR